MPTSPSSSRLGFYSIFTRAEYVFVCDFKSKRAGRNPKTGSHGLARRDRGHVPNCRVRNPLIFLCGFSRVRVNAVLTFSLSSPRREKSLGVATRINTRSPLNVASKWVDSVNCCDTLPSIYGGENI